MVEIMLMFCGLKGLLPTEEFLRKYTRRYLVYINNIVLHKVYFTEVDMTIRFCIYLVLFTTPKYRKINLKMSK